MLSSSEFIQREAIELPKHYFPMTLELSLLNIVSFPEDLK
jgi:hypothetical protein